MSQRKKVLVLIAAFVLAFGGLTANDLHKADPAQAIGLCPTKITNATTSDSTIQVRENMVSTAKVVLRAGQSTPYSLPAKNYCYAYTATSDTKASLWYVFPGSTPDYSWYPNSWRNIRDAEGTYASVTMTVG